LPLHDALPISGAQSYGSFEAFVSVFFITKITQFKRCINISCSQFITVVVPRSFRPPDDLSIGGAGVCKRNLAVFKINIAGSDSYTGCKTKVGFAQRKVITYIGVDPTTKT